MAFWGVEVKPGKPFTHLPHSIGGRLHVSQATLGFGTASKKSVVQCNVGNRSPVFLCSLFPEQAESCQLNLEFEEADEVVFSVIGPRSVHLTGYYLGSSRQCKVDDESESYGEDILDTETDRSDGSGDEDEYEDSFIDDDDLRAIPPSPSLSAEVAEETLLGDRKKDAKEKSAKAKHRRLRKKYQSSPTDDDFTAKRQALSNDGMGKMEKECEDTTTISSLLKSASRTTKLGAQEDTGQVIVTDCELLRRPHEYYHTQPSNVYNDVKPKKKMKKKPTEEKEDKVEVDFFFDQFLTWDKAQQNHMKVDQSNQDTALMNGDVQKSEKDKGESSLHFYLPSDEVIGGMDAKTGKRKKKQAKETKPLGVDKTFNIVDKEDQSRKAGRERTEQDSLLKTREDEKQANDEGGNPLHSSMPSDESLHEIVAKTGKRKKKQVEEEKSLGANIPVDNVSREDQAQPDKATCENTAQGSLLKSGDIPKQANDEEVNSLHSDELVHVIEAVPKPKKKRKKPAKDEALEADANRSKMVIEACGDEQNKMQTINVEVDNNVDQSRNENHNVQKKKKKSRVQENGEDLNMNESMNSSVVDAKEKNANGKSKKASRAKRQDGKVVAP